MKKNNPTLLWLAAVLAIALPSVHCKSVKNTATSEPPAVKEVLFYDDFSRSSLDRTKWNVLVTGKVANDELQAYVDSSVTLQIVKGREAEGAQNGALKLIPRYTPGFVAVDGRVTEFISARLHTRDKFEFTYGTASARIKMTKGQGLWPAWWMLGKGKWPETGEIDIMEYVGEKDWASAAIHGPKYSGNTPFVKRHTFDSTNEVSQWHIYTVDWTPDELIFKYDGAEMYRITKDMVARYGKWAFDNPEYLLLNYAVGGGYPYGVNGIKGPRYGLSDAGLEEIKKGTAYMLVDWVRVGR